MIILFPIGFYFNSANGKLSNGSFIISYWYLNQVSHKRLEWLKAGIYQLQWVFPLLRVLLPGMEEMHYTRNLWVFIYFSGGDWFWLAEWFSVGLTNICWTTKLPFLVDEALHQRGIQAPKYVITKACLLFNLPVWRHSDTPCAYLLTGTVLVCL